MHLLRSCYHSETIWTIVCFFCDRSNGSTNFFTHSFFLAGQSVYHSDGCTDMARGLPGVPGMEDKKTVFTGPGTLYQNHETKSMIGGTLMLTVRISRCFFVLFLQQVDPCTSLMALPPEADWADLYSAVSSPVHRFTARPCFDLTEGLDWMFWQSGAPSLSLWKQLFTHLGTLVEC